MNTRLLLGIMPLGGAAVAAFIMANRRHREPQPELPEHRTVRLLGHEVEALTNRLRDLATRTPDVQQLISDVQELRADVRRLAGEVEAYRVERSELGRRLDTAVDNWTNMEERLAKLEREHTSYPRASFPRTDPGIGGGGTIAMASNSGLSASAHPPAESEKPEG